MKSPGYLLFSALLGCSLPFLALSADVVPASLFRDHAVLQQGMPVPVWGTADEGEQVTVTIAGQSSTTTAQGGRWSVRLAPLPAGGPYDLVIAGRNRVVLSDVLVGEVWICSGQSNMERQLGLREGQQPIKNWQAEAAGANFPRIRHFEVAQKIAPVPQASVDGQWLVCSPENAPKFTAVGFFFGRALHLSKNVPIGLIHTSWGGTPAEAWTSAAGLDPWPEYAATIANLRKSTVDAAAAEADYQRSLTAWYATNDPGSSTAMPWFAETLPEQGWSRMTLPANWETTDLPGLDGLVWFRREFNLPETWAGRGGELHLGAIDDADVTWINGVEIGSTEGWKTPRVYPVAAGLLKPGRNVVAVRVLDTGGGGGLWGGPDDTLRLAALGQPTLPVLTLDGEWRYQLAMNFKNATRPPTSPRGNAGTPTVLYNGMIAPLLPYAMRGVIWYQGEANSGRSQQYRTLFPAMIDDWRRLWGQGDFPFLYVQIAPFKDMPPEIREAQLLALDRTKNTAMAVTLDVGDAEDIHPTDKRPVGERLALAARALAYGEQLEFSGPLFSKASFNKGRVVLEFTHVGGGLVAKDGELKGFTIAGTDKVFHPAKAVISGETVVVSAASVPDPVAVRYAWANVPEGNLFNRASLPASPFRTDVE